MTTNAPIAFDNRYVRLPERLFARVAPEPVRAPRCIRVNRALAARLGIDPAWLRSPEGVAVLAGNRVPDGAAPIALGYAGHQFGGFVPELGDGRAVLLGEVVGVDGVRYDIQLKGSGRTPYSRRGDGRAPLGPVLREYIVSEAMFALGVPTTRSLAAVATGEPVMRERPLPGGVLTRVAQSHIRVGTFELLAARRDEAGLRALTHHVIERHAPACAEADHPALALLDEVVARQAELIARWQLLGFVHGVMNTDNMLVSGETIDYGPCAFLDRYDPVAVFSSIDHGGRYAYENQPRIAAWNLASLAEALVPIVDLPEAAALARARAALARFAAVHEAAFDRGLRRKVGLARREDGDAALLADLLATMHRAGADFTLAFRRLADLAAPTGDGVASVYELPPAMEPWLTRWRARLEREEASPEQRQAAMAAVNPAVIPRNHLVEEAIAAAVERDDFAPFHALVAVTTDPYTFTPHLATFARPPRPDQVVRQTFCGT